MAEAFRVEPAAIDDDALLGQVPGWDSMGHLRIVLEIESELGLELEVEKIMSLESVQDVASLLEEFQTVKEA